MNIVNKLLSVKPFNYEIVYLHNNATERVESAIIVIPNGWKWDDGEYSDIVVHVHNEDDKEINFKNVDDAQRFLDEHRDALEFAWTRDELHAMIGRKNK